MFSIHGKRFLALKKVRITKITPPQVPVPVKFSIPPTGGGIYPPSFPTPYYYLENPAETQ